MANKKCDIQEYYSAIKKNEILPFVTTWMNIEGIMYVKYVKERNTLWFHVHVKSKK